MSNPNLKVWDKVKTTNPRYTKSFKGDGGFQGTAISAMYRVQMATEQFGPLGIGWGYEIADEKIMHEVWHIRLNLWYMIDGVKGVVTQWGASKIIEHRRGRDGKPDYDFLDEEAPKKATTDAMTKCLSLLGFNADIHLGKWDDPDYRHWAEQKAERDEQAARAAAAEEKKAAAAPAVATGDTPPADAKAAAQQKLTPKQLANVWYVHLRRINKLLADDINAQKELTDEQRSDKLGRELANCLYVQMVDKAAAKELSIKYCNDLPAAIAAFVEAIAKQPKAAEQAAK